MCSPIPRWRSPPTRTGAVWTAPCVPGSTTLSPRSHRGHPTGPPTTRFIWLGLEDQFVGNKETRALILDAKFRTFVQGELSTSDYCCRLKGMADALGDLGEVVIDRTLVLAVLHGFNGRFSRMSSLLKRQRLFPTFTEVHNDLQLEEIKMAARPGAPVSSLVATTVAAGHSLIFDISLHSAAKKNICIQLQVECDKATRERARETISERWHERNS
jgi:hypothetical protein